MTPPPRDGRRLVPAYLATTGRARPSRNTLDRLTVLHGAADPATVSGLRPEEIRLLELLRGGALSRSPRPPRICGSRSVWSRSWWPTWWMRAG